MRARFAYISSLGTTAILVAAALLILAVGSAIVAFRGWPGTASGESVQSVPLAPRSAATGAVKAAPATPVRRRLLRSQPARRTATPPRRARSTVGLVKVPGSGRSNLVPGLVMVPAPAATTPPPVAPQSVSQPSPSTGVPPTRPGPPSAHTPLPDPGQLVPGPGVPVLPGVEEVETMVGGVLANTPPLPGGVHVHVPLGLGR